MEIIIVDSEIAKEIREIVKDAEHTYSTIEEGVKEAIAGVQQLPDYEQHAGSLIGMAIRKLFYEYRSSTNRQIKKAAGNFSNTPRTQYHRTAAVRQHHTDMYQMRLDGRALGEMTGNELLALADKFSRLKDGYAAQETFARKVVKLIPNEKMGERLSTVVSEKKVLSVYNSTLKHTPKELVA